MNYILAPSLLSADLTRLGEEVTALIEAGADFVHFDVMDNHYVPNLTLGPFVCHALHQRFPNLGIDVHLMANPVDSLIIQFAKAGAKRISIHPDGTIHLDRSLQLIIQHGCEAGLALNPSTSLECLKWCHQKLHFVLIMTVNPGFAGQELIVDMIQKIKEVKKNYPRLPICVDGGVGLNNLEELARAGVTQFVMGTAIFKTEDYGKIISQCRAKLSHIN